MFHSELSYLDTLRLIVELLGSIIIVTIVYIYKKKARILRRISYIASKNDFRDNLVEQIVKAEKRAPDYKGLK